MPLSSSGSTHRKGVGALTLHVVKLVYKFINILLIFFMKLHYIYIIKNNYTDIINLYDSYECNTI